MARKVIMESNNQQGKPLIGLIYQGKINQVSSLVFTHKHNIAGSNSTDTYNNDKACRVTVYGIPSTHGASQADYKIIDNELLNLSGEPDEYISTIIPGERFNGYTACRWEISYDDSGTNHFTDLASAVMVFKDSNPVAIGTNNPGYVELN